jgi:hypothetical protein
MFVLVMVILGCEPWLIREGSRTFGKDRASLREGARWGHDEKEMSQCEERTRRLRVQGKKTQSSLEAGITPGSKIGVRRGVGDLPKMEGMVRPVWMAKVFVRRKR